jgi:hypothetical protein
MCDLVRGLFFFLIRFRRYHLIFWKQEVIRLLTNFRSGLGQTLGQVIVGRLIAGVGGAGINCLVSIVIAGKRRNCSDLVK